MVVLGRGAVSYERGTPPPAAEPGWPAAVPWHPGLPCNLQGYLAHNKTILHPEPCTHPIGVLRSQETILHPESCTLKPRSATLQGYFAHQRLSCTLNPAPYTLHPATSSLDPQPYRGTSLIRSRLPLGPYSINIPRALWCSSGGELFLMSEVAL